ncbi:MULTISPECIES: AsmA family protein [Acidobacteriaceae]|uniref:AsmA family protein n=1 Tax=Acidobacteriaceae TaxID=204434 RepID=UPI00131B10DD|nr:MULTISPECIES: AsmA family protein [Acidobacteriaceae]MDW5264621.1 AsmA family protein [Edaphobacter sp.]
MQEIDPIHAQSDTESPRPGIFRRFLFLWLALLALLLLAIVPPLISVNRLQHRIATSISQSLGRPVHLDQVTLNLLPLPGFTLNNLVVDEDPAFGSEPIIRANSVRVTLRIRSLWTKRVEFSTISFTDPSVNLVHLPNGKWNLESILLQASHIEAAPTAQKKAGPTPRFPYIEATGARLNIKLGQEKIPLSFTDAEFALWLPSPEQWHLRLKANPARTDTVVSGAGTIQVEGTLGRAASLRQVPIHLQGEWRDAPLGGASRVLFGRDAGWRGNMTLSANIQGTVGNSSVEAKFSTSDARRADFVPKHPLNIELECLGTATNLFHGFDKVRCSWPPSGSSGTQVLMLSGSLPDIHDLNAATVDLSIPGIPADTLLDWLHVVNERVPADVTMGGTLTGSISHHPDALPAAPSWQGAIFVTGAKLVSTNTGTSSLVSGNIAIHSATQPGPKAHLRTKHSAPPATGSSFVLAPAALALGGKEPATLEGHFDATGYTLHLTGIASPSRLLALGTALPELGDGLMKALPANHVATPSSVDLTAVRSWGGAQVWTANSPHPSARHPRRAGRP